MKPRELIEWRTRNNVTQQTMTRLTGATRRTIINWEKGATPIPRPVQVLCKVADGKVKAWEAAVEATLDGR